MSKTPEQAGGSGRRGSRRRPYGTADPALDARLQELVDDLGLEDPAIAFEMLATAVRLAGEGIGRANRKLANAALKEMRYAFSVFGRYRDVRKVSIFGSARAKEGHPEYEAARHAASLIVEHGWMVVTGAGPGVMAAGNEGAGGGRSFGVNIVLPFEAKPNPFIADDPKLINFKYFFTRKLMFVKEADGFILLPGGFGTMDEAFELLTLIQTGKSDLHPIVLLEAPGGTYWRAWRRFVGGQLLTRGYIDEDDFHFVRVTDRPEEAVEELVGFYRIYHSQRYVGDRLILRLRARPDGETVAALSEEFADILTGPMELTGATPPEIRDGDVPHLPRLALPFDRTHMGRLRRLIDRLNALPLEPEPGTGPAGAENPSIPVD